MNQLQQEFGDKIFDAIDSRKKSVAEEPANVEVEPAESVKDAQNFNEMA